MTQTTTRPHTALSLRERAQQALREDEGRAQQRIMAQADLRLVRLQDTLIGLLSSKLDVHLDDRSELHEIAGPSGLMPAYKVEDLTFTLGRSNPNDGYDLTLVTWCKACREINRWTIGSLADLQRTLDHGPCWKQHGEAAS